VIIEKKYMHEKFVCSFYELEKFIKKSVIQVRQIGSTLGLGWSFGMKFQPFRLAQRLEKYIFLFFACIIVFPLKSFKQKCLKDYDNKK
jgi:hypothetical protein